MRQLARTAKSDTWETQNHRTTLHLLGGTLSAGSSEKPIRPFYKRRCQDKCLPATAKLKVFAIQPL
jgi:hypothetical protein